MVRNVSGRFGLFSLVFVLVLALSAMGDVSWNDFTGFSGTTTPYASNGPGCFPPGQGTGTSTYTQPGQGCPGGIADDLGAVWVDMTSDYIGWQLMGPNKINASFCNSTGSVSNFLILEFDSDNNQSTGAQQNEGYPGADYKVLLNASGAFFLYYSGGTFVTNSSVNVSTSNTCNQGIMKFAVNRSVISNLQGMRFEVNVINQGLVESLGHSGDQMFMNTGSRDMMFEGQHPCRTINISGNCTSVSNISGTIYKCFWDSFPNTCNPDFRFGGGGSGMSCSDFCGACNTTATCLAGGRGKCKVVTAPSNMPTGITPFETNKMCVEDMTKFVQGAGSCDSNCKYCFSSSTCGNSTYPNPLGSGAGCKWVTDTQFGKSWCDLSTTNYDFTCSVSNFAKCLNQTGCEAVSGNWSANFNYCYNASAELCYDGTDNDGDTLIDCVDSSCSKDSACGGNIDVLTGGFGTLDPYEAMKKQMFQNMDPGAPVRLSSSAPTLSLRGDLDALGFSIKDMGTSLGMGLDVRNMSESLLCGGLNSEQYFFLVDIDVNTSTGCTVNISGTNYTGFEYKFEYLINNNGSGGSLEVRRGYRCFNGAFSLYGAKLAGAPVEANYGNLPVSCQASVAIMAVDKTDMGNPQDGIRFMAASADNVTLLSAANDTNLGNNNEGIYYTAGTVDFKPTNCFDNPMACGTAFSMIGGGKFMPFEDCFLSSGDEDLDGLTNCADSDCSMAPWCSGTDYTTNDKTAPTVQSNKAETFNDFVFLHWVTNEPSNGTIAFYSSCASSAVTYTFYELGNPAMTADDYRPWHDLPIRNGQTASVGGAITLSSSTTYYYKLTACDRAGNCAYSGCLNFTTASTAANVQYKFDFVPPVNPLLNDMAMRIWNGTIYINVTQGSTTNTGYMQNATLKFDNPMSNWSIDLEGIDLAQATNLNLSDAFNMSNSSGNTYIGMSNLKWTELSQSLGADSILLMIPDGGDFLQKCNENNLSDCSDVTNANGVTKVAGGAGYSNTTWRIPTSLGFSVYTVVDADNTTYNLTFTNQSALTKIVGSNVNATFNVSILNGENTTRVYNLTLSIVNSSSLTPTGVSGRINGTTMMQVNITNGTTYTNVIIDVNGTISGQYFITILATLYNNASIVLNSTGSEDMGLLTTIVDATAPTITLNTANNTWTSNNQSSLNFTFVDAFSSTATCNLYVDGTLVNASLSASNNTATLITPNVTLAEGARTWYVNCTDLYSNGGTSTPRILNIDQTAPDLSIINPSNATWNNSATPSFVFNYTDALSSTANCTLYVDSVAKGNNASVVNATSTTITSSSLTGGTRVWHITCLDLAGNQDEGSDFTLYVDLTYPTSLVNNVNGISTGYGTTNATLTINYTANDTNIINWTLSVYNSSWSLLQNWTATTNNLSAVQTYTAATNGTYYVNLTVRDNATNINTTSFTVYVDQVDPIINSLSVGSVTSSGGTLTVNATDSISGIDSCTYSGAGSGTLTLSSGLYTASITGRSASTSYTVTVNCTDLAGRSVTNTTSFTTSASSSSSSSSSSGGGAPTGASGGVSSGASGSFQQKTWTSINVGETASVVVPNGEIGVTEVSFDLTRTMYGIWLKVAKLSSLPTDVTKFDKKSYRYIEITKSLVFKESDFKNVQVEFKVEKSWLTKNKLTAEGVVLYRYVEGKWTELKTIVGKDDGTYIYYSAETPGFSYFLIGEKVLVATSAVQPLEPVIVPETTLTEEAPAVETKSSNWLWIFGGIVLLGLVFWLVTQWKKNSGKTRRK